MPPILHSVRQQAKRQLVDLIQTLFNNTDDALFDLADRSRNDADQHMFFESMRQIRLHRKQISSQFIHEFYQGFEQAFQADAEPDSVDFDSAVDQMTLVPSDDLEVSVTTAGIVSKATSQFSLPIMQLTKRVDHLCKDGVVTERTNPLGPDRISRSFVCAIDTLEVDIKVRIILIKMFERSVMECLGPLYESANSLLAEAGVLADLKEIMRRGRNQRPPPTNARSEDVEGTRIDAAKRHAQETAGAGADESFDAIRSLIARARGGPPIPQPDAGSGLSTRELMTLLSDVQADADQHPFDLTEVPPVLNLRQVVATKARQATGRSSAGMAQADDDAVNFVGMLFDYILNDRNLAIPMKALIGRLQIPIVKLAVIDKSFFEKSGHPARQLLNELSSAGIGWSAGIELKRDALYNKIESIVLQVMNGFKENQNLFAELVAELRQFVSKDDTRHALLAQRVKQTETGKAKTVAAKRTVQQLINQKASGMRMPPDVGRFVSDTWSKVLVYACVKDGTASAAWLRDVQALEDLIWCLQPLDNMPDLQRREEMFPELISALNEGMEHIKLADGERHDLVAMLESQLRQVSEHDRAYLEDDEPVVASEPFEMLEEIVLTANDDEAENVPPPEPAVAEQINRLREGVWVELTQESGDTFRCKLAAIIKPGDRYIFVNRRGMKVLEKTRMGLAVELKRKTMTILDESQVFDRALRAVIGNLRQMQHQPEF
ncbi:MAG: DUF1631 domain-containing protein [Gammaproteobacteria bacterium]|nr:DUF1631 domain-containing protein [Gammaproteobacteria bacterium]